MRVCQDDEIKAAEWTINHRSVTRNRICAVKEEPNVSGMSLMCRKAPITTKVTMIQHLLLFEKG